MNNQQACELIEQLIAGVHPTTGELLTSDSVCSDPMVLRALHRATLALRTAEQPPKRNRSEAVRTVSAPPGRRTRESRARNKEPWTSEEDAFARQAYAEGRGPAAIGTQLQRSEHNVKMRLFALGAATRDELGLSAQPGMNNRGMPWFPEQDTRLAELFKGGAAPADIARQMQRSLLSILYRLEKLGLIADHALYLSGLRDADHPNGTDDPPPPPEEAPPEDGLPF